MTLQDLLALGFQQTPDGKMFLPFSLTDLGKRGIYQSGGTSPEGENFEGYYAGVKPSEYGGMQGERFSNFEDAFRSYTPEYWGASFGNNQNLFTLPSTSTPGQFNGEYGYTFDPSQLMYGPQHQVTGSGWEDFRDDFVIPALTMWAGSGGLTGALDSVAANATSADIAGAGSSAGSAAGSAGNSLSSPSLWDEGGGGSAFNGTNAAGSEGALAGTKTGGGMDIEFDPYTGDQVGYEGLFQGGSGDSYSFDFPTTTTSGGGTDYAKYLKQALALLTLGGGLAEGRKPTTSSSSVELPPWYSAGALAALGEASKMGDFKRYAPTDESVGTYMNPYIKGALDPAADEIRRDFARKRSTAGAQAGMKGAFGTDRDLIERSLLDEAEGKSLGALYGTGYANAYDKALGADYGEAQNARMWPRAKVDAIAAALRGAGDKATTTTTTASPPSLLGQAAGALGTYNAANKLGVFG